METRLEHDSMGDVLVPKNAYFGAETQRAVDNFTVSGQRLPPALVSALGVVKLAAVTVNRDLGRLSSLSDRQVESLVAAAREVASGRFDEEFPIDVFQTGSGTSSHMNANEVIANRAIELSGGDRFTKAKAIHPKDHVNLGQSSNDVFPTAIHVAVARAVATALLPALAALRTSLDEKALAFDGVLKIGRTHLADATPIRLGQEFSGFARQASLGEERAARAIRALAELPVGGTAVGTGINTHPAFGARVAAFLAAETGLPFVEAKNHFEANASRDALVEAHALVRVVATSLFEIANNLRLLASGPRCAIQEIRLPSLQPGSSIMPGKVNPVICESVMQIATRVVGNDATVMMAGATGGQFQLHALMPVMAHAALESVELLARAARALDEKCIRGVEPNELACREGVEKSLSMVTSLAPKIGYERAAELAKEALRGGATIRSLAIEKGILPENELDEALDPMRMTRPDE